MLTEEREGIAAQALLVLGHSAAAVEPVNGASHDPAPGKHYELADIRMLDDRDVDLPADPGQPLLKFGLT